MQAQIHYPMLDMTGIPLFLDKLAGEQRSHDCAHPQRNWE